MVVLALRLGGTRELAELMVSLMSLMGIRVRGEGSERSVEEEPGPEARASGQGMSVLHSHPLTPLDPTLSSSPEVLLQGSGICVINCQFPVLLLSLSGYRGNPFVEQ